MSLYDTLLKAQAARDEALAAYCEADEVGLDELISLCERVVSLDKVVESEYKDMIGYALTLAQESCEL